MILGQLGIEEVKPHWLFKWCSMWPDGLWRELRDVWGHLCMIHDVMGALTAQGLYGAVRVGSTVYTWEKLGYDYVPAQKEQDQWLRDSMIEYAGAHPKLSEEARTAIVRNAKIMYAGLRSFGRLYRAIPFLP